MISSPSEIGLRVAALGRRSRRSGHDPSRGNIGLLGSLAPRHPTVRRNDVDYVVFCFANPDHAESFRVAFAGQPFDPSQRGRRTRWHEWWSGS